jgi:hypothetical protein
LANVRVVGQGSSGTIVEISQCEGQDYLSVAWDDGDVSGIFDDQVTPEQESDAMHYKNGREAKNGDKVMIVSGYNAPMVGILYDAKAGNNDCNGKLAVIRSNDPCPDLKDCLHCDDVQEAAASSETCKKK